MEISLTPITHLPISIFKYQNAHEFLCDWIAQRQTLDSSFSIRKWARKMDVSHALLVMLLGGKRELKLKHVPALAKGMDLSSPEKMFLQGLIELGSADSPEEKELLTGWLAGMNPGVNFKVKEVEEFRAISSWLHMATLAVSDIPGQVITAESIHELFKSRASIHEVRATLDRLLDLQLLTRDEEGNLKSTYQRVTTRDDVSSEAVKEYHSKISKIAADCVFEQSVDEREYQSFAIALDPKSLPLAKEMIRNFRTQFGLALKTGRPSEIYHVNLQLFRLSERSPGIGRAEDDVVDTRVCLMEQP